MTLSWLPPVNDSNCIVQYAVYANETYLVTTTGLTYTILTVYKGITNNYSVTSIDTAGRESESSNIVTIVWKGKCLYVLHVPWHDFNI